jgi:hypothetical protein
MHTAVSPALRPQRSVRLLTKRAQAAATAGMALGLFNSDLKRHSANMACSSSWLLTPHVVQVQDFELTIDIDRLIREVDYDR